MRRVRVALVTFGALPIVYALARAAGVDASLLAPLDRWFSFQCHQLAGRSPSVLPVCWRCVGLYFGLAFGALLPWMRASGKRLALVTLGALLVMALDVWTERAGLRASSAPMRLITGLMLAFPIGSRGARLFSSRAGTWPDMTAASRETETR